MKRILIAVPCYNEEMTVINFHRNLLKALTIETKDKPTLEDLNMSNYKFDVLYVDDGSKDGTWKDIKDLYNFHTAPEQNDILRVKGISFSKNFGKESAMKAALDYASDNDYDGLILMDADGQDDPNIIKKLLYEESKGYQVVLTRHKTRQGQSLVYKTLSKSFYKVYGLLTGQKKTTRGLRDYSFLGKRAIEALRMYKNKRRFFKGMINDIGFERKLIEFDYKDRTTGTTKWNYRKLFKYALTGIFQFSQVYKVMFILVALLITGLLGFNVSLFFWNNINEYLSQIILTEVSLIGLLTTFTSIAILSMQYEAKEICTNKPDYIVECEYESENN